MTQRSSAYTGRTVTFATMHGKELLARDAFHHILGATVTAPRALDTDQFGNSKQDSYKRTTQRPAERSPVTQHQCALPFGGWAPDLSRQSSLEQCRWSPIVSAAWNNSLPRTAILPTRNRQRQSSTKRCPWSPSQPGQSSVTGSTWNMLVHPGSGFGSQDLGQLYAVSDSMTCWKKVYVSAGVSQLDTAVTRKHTSRSSRHVELEEPNRNATNECLKRFTHRG